MLLVASVPDLEMNLDAIPLDTESVINPVGSPRDGRRHRAKVGDRDDSRLSRIAAGPPRDQGPEAAAAMTAPSSEGPAVLLAEESLWSAGPCYIGHLRYRLLAAARAPGMMHTSLMTI
ncbi:unnamed protein product, partial [Symbiodinium pilosum]